MNIKTISGGYQVPDDNCLGKFQIESDRLDHDRHLVPIACEHIIPGMAVLDGGAFNGDHAVAYRRAASSMGDVFCVEANPFTFDMLRHNMLFQDMNDVAFVGRWHCIHAALGKFAGYVHAEMKESPNLGASHFVKSFVVTREAQPFQMVSIDFLAQLFKVKFGFIKLDIEGFELEALEGAKHTMKWDRPTFMIEICAETLKRQNATPQEIFQRLEAYEYSWEILQPECTVDSPQYDILATPR